MKHELIVLDSTGDSRVAWDSEDKLSISAAMAEFDRLVARGYRGAKMDSPESGTMTSKFNPESDLVMVPNIHAG